MGYEFIVAPDYALVINKIISQKRSLSALDLHRSISIKHYVHMRSITVHNCNISNNPVSHDHLNISKKQNTLILCKKKQNKKTKKYDPCVFNMKYLVVQKCIRTSLSKGTFLCVLHLFCSHVILVFCVHSPCAALWIGTSQLITTTHTGVSVSAHICKRIIPNGSEIRMLRF